MYHNHFRLYYYSSNSIQFIFAISGIQCYSKMNYSSTTQNKEMASVTLHNTNKENNRAKSERSFALFYFLSFYWGFWFGLDFEFGLGLTLGLELELEFETELGLGLGYGIAIFLFLHNVSVASG